MNAIDALLREIILRALDELASPDGTIQADPLTATEHIMRAIELSDGGRDE